MYVCMYVCVHMFIWSLNLVRFQVHPYNMYVCMYVCMYVFQYILWHSIWVLGHGAPQPDKLNGNLPEADGVGRKLKFVVYEPIKAGYFEGFIRSR